MGKVPTNDMIETVDYANSKGVVIDNCSLIEKTEREKKDIPKGLHFPQNVIALYSDEEESISEDLLVQIVDESLTERQKTIFYRRYKDNATLQAIGEELGCSRERIRQLLVKIDARINRKFNSRKPSKPKDE
jgi:RNA polymerase sigma factor (sigma-70 family)